MEFKELNTSRLNLRIVDHDVMNEIYNKYEIKDQLRLFGFNSVEELEAERRKFEEGYSTYNKKFLNFQLLLKDSAEIIGWCGYHTWYIDHNRAEIGYGITKEDYKRQGFMSEALGAILTYGFDTMKLNRVEAFIGPFNKASLKLVSSYNFIQEGRLREHYAHNGKLEDSLVFSLLKSEFEKK